MARKKKNIPVPPAAEAAETASAVQMSVFMPAATKGPMDEYFGLRNVPPLHDGEIALERFGFVPVAAAFPDCHTVYRASGKSVGILARLPLKKVWALANRAADGSAAAQYGITESTWNAASARLSDYVCTHDLRSLKNGPLLLQDVWKIHEIDFEELFLDRAKNVAALMRAAIEADIEESTAVASRWKRIKRYPHKVELAEEDGGIFSDADVKILTANGIKTLNDIRKKNIYFLKNLFLEHDYQRLPEEINAAFKEDLEQRKDFRFQFWPIFLGVCASIATAVIGFVFQYTLLKNKYMTLTIFGLLALWLITVMLIIHGAFRARRRRRTKRPYYRYLSKPMKFAFSGFVLVSFLSIATTTVFYERYDGYDDTYFYRNLGNNEITIAGLFDKDAEDLSLPLSIDEKTVTAVSPQAFRGSKAVTATIPDTVIKVGASAFKNCKSLTGAVIPTSVTQLPSGIFSGCRSLLSFRIPSSITSIGNSAFSGSGLQSMTVPANVTAVGNDVFKNCHSLGTVHFAGALESLGSGAFYKCENLTAVTCDDLSALTEVKKNTFAGCMMLTETNLFDNAETVGKNALESCVSLTSFSLPAAKQIGKGVFNNCFSLETLVVPFLGETRESASKSSYLFNRNTPVSSITLTDAVRIADKAFAGLKTLRTVKLPDTVTEIGKSAFRSCGALTDVVLPSGITEIRANTFEECTALQELDFPANLVTLGDAAFAESGIRTAALPAALVNVGKSAFEDCTMLAYVQFRGPLAQLGASAFEGCEALVSVSCDDPSSLKRIEKNTFKECVSLTETDLFEYAEFVGDSALEDCESLGSFTVPAATEMGKNIFRGCKSLQTLTVPFLGKKRDSSNSCGYLFDVRTSIRRIAVTDALLIGKNAFAKLYSLEEVILPDTAERVGEGAFRDCTGLMSVRLPAGLVRVEEETFQGCRNLGTISGVTGLEFVGDSAFQGCSALQTTDFISRITTFGKRAFYGCSSLTDISFDGAAEIGESAFAGCSRLTSVTFSAALRQLGDHAFASTGLAGVDLSSLTGVTFGSYVFSDCDELTSVTLPTDLETVPEGLASGCGNLKQFTIAPHLSAIGPQAFQDTGITSLEIPSTLRTIGEMAFSGSKLQTVVVPSTIEALGENAFACTTLAGYMGPFLGGSREKTSNGYRYLFGRNASVKEIVLTEMPTVKGSVFNGGQQVLQAVALPQTTVVTDGVFQNFKSLTDVVLSDRLATIGKNVFYGCTALKSIELPASLTTIGSGAFRNCTSLSGIRLPDGLKELGSSSFNGCKNLTSFVVPDSVETMGSDLFKNCSSLRELSLPFIGKTREKAKKLSYITGSSNTLETVVVTDGGMIAERAFKNFYSLRAIVLGGNILSIGEEAFYGCTGLQSISIPRSLQVWEGTFPEWITVRYTD